MSRKDSRRLQASSVIHKRERSSPRRAWETGKSDIRRASQERDQEQLDAILEKIEDRGRRSAEDWRAKREFLKRGEALRAQLKTEDSSSSED